MARANPDIYPPPIRKIAGPYQAFPEIEDIKRRDTNTTSANNTAEHPRLVASDTLSDWRRKSATTCPSCYPSEHRRDRRRTARQDVRLHRRGKNLGTTRTCDVNARGIGVECGKLNLHEGDVVEVDLPANTAPPGMGLRACCLVVHTGKQCGLMFLDMKDA